MCILEQKDLNIDSVSFVLFCFIKTDCFKLKKKDKYCMVFCTREIKMKSDIYIFESLSPFKMCLKNDAVERHYSRSRSVVTEDFLRLPATWRWCCCCCGCGDIMEVVVLLLLGVVRFLPRLGDDSERNFSFNIFTYSLDLTLIVFLPDPADPRIAADFALAIPTASSIVPSSSPSFSSFSKTACCFCCCFCWSRLLYLLMYRSLRWSSRDE